MVYRGLIKGNMPTSRVILNMRSEYVKQLDELVSLDVAPSRNALLEKIVDGFLSDLKAKRMTEKSALGGLIEFILLTVDEEIIASIFKKKS